MIKYILLFIMLIFLSGIGYYNLINENDFEIFVNNEIIEENNLPPKVFFSKTSNLTQIYIDYLDNASDIKCAFYDIDKEIIINKLKDKNAIVTIEDSNALNDFKTGKSYGYMHNKFCIIDNKTVITGSANPTNRGLSLNDNNIIVIYSKYIIKNYLDEFEELINNDFGKGLKVKYHAVKLNNKTILKNYFCPEDSCKKKVIEELNKANKSIYFMTFSFTDMDIAEIIVEKSKNDIDVKGVFERTRYNNKYEVYKYLNLSNVTIIPDKNKYNMHHKVFIIDNMTVIAGSYNPTKSGNEKNDENILIITDEFIAKQYLKEFNRLVECN